MTCPSLGLVVPVYDEAGRFDEFGDELVAYICRQAQGSRLLFVDDGSTDGTPDLVRRLIARSPDGRVSLLERPHEGKGAAVAAGISAMPTDYVGFCDLDLSTPLDQFDLVVDSARRAPVLAIGSRDLTASTLVRPEGRVREALGRAYNRLLQAAVVPGVVDTQCGAKVAARAVWAEILPFCGEQGFAWDAEAVAVAIARGIGVRQVPIEWRHDERSKVHVTRDGLRMVRATPRVRRSARRAAAAGPARLGHPVGQPHWWFRSKAALVATALRRTRRPHDAAGLLVDVGSGTGQVTSLLGWHPARTIALDADTELVASARAGHGITPAAADATRLPLAPGSASVVCLLDVLEHLDDPAAAVAEAARAVDDAGRLVVTVPAHPWLWSRADEELGHRRRYRTRDAVELLTAGGFEPVLTGHAFAWLVLPALATRGAGAGERLARSAAVPAASLVALVLTALERLLLGRVAVPFGTTLVCVARKRSGDTAAGSA